MPEQPTPPTPLSPIYEAQHSARYARQQRIRAYQAQYGCNLIVCFGPIFASSAYLYEELLIGLDASLPLHVLLSSPGGDGETAVRLVRSAQQRCSELVVILPGQAKSAATLFALGAHRILMGPTSDLGPVDPQLRHGPGDQLVAAKDIVAAVDNAAAKVQEAPETYPLWASMLQDVTAVFLQQARSALNRSSDLLQEALKSHPARTSEQVEALLLTLRESLIDRPQSHGAIISAKDAREAGLPVEDIDPRDQHWRDIFSLASQYLILPANDGIYEGERVSQILLLPGS